MFEYILSVDVLLSFLMLASLEIVLGIDNIIFLSILTNRLPKNEQPRARTLGLFLAMLTRVGLLLSLSWLIGFTTPLFSFYTQDFSGRDLVLIFGGLFLITKATLEIHQSLEGIEENTPTSERKKAVFISIVLQIAVVDIIFSLDSVITAVGLVREVPVMVAAIVAAMFVMMFLAGKISQFIDDHPTLKMLALSFLTLIGVALIADGFNQHIPKGYLYFAMAFSSCVELLNIKLRKASEPVKLRQKNI